MGGGSWMPRISLRKKDQTRLFDPNAAQFRRPPVRFGNNCLFQPPAVKRVDLALHRPTLVLSNNRPFPPLDTVVRSEQPYPPHSSRCRHRRRSPSNSDAYRRQSTPLSPVRARPWLAANFSIISSPSTTTQYIQPQVPPNEFFQGRSEAPSCC